MNVCVVGHGMMGKIHSDTLRSQGVTLHTLVGRRPEPTREFADHYGYKHWTLSLDEALADPAIDVVILANPSELHAETALAALAHGKHTLVEIPIAMTLSDAERVVAAAHQQSTVFGVVHPMRMYQEIQALRGRALAGEECVRHISGRFFVHRLENVGITGYRRSWTDNLLWHHTTHLLDFGLWLFNEPVRHAHTYMSPLDPKTGTPMEVFLGIETESGRSLVCTGSYYSRERFFDALVVTDQDSYRIDGFGDRLKRASLGEMAAPWADACAAVTRDFIQAIREERQPAVTGDSVLPAMQILQMAQNLWDQQYGAQAIPGRQATRSS